MGGAAGRGRVVSTGSDYYVEFSGIDRALAPNPDAIVCCCEPPEAIPAAFISGRVVDRFAGLREKRLLNGPRLQI
jgi:hypothetical protein